ncbi:MAG: ribosomal protein S18-alanine N-acetyltransferase [Acidobacteriota bacterium]
MQNSREKTESKIARDFYIDVMKVSDVDEVLEIERATFPTPWSKANFLFELKQNKCAHNFVIRRIGEERIIGFSCTWILFGELKINNIAVRREHRGMGLGRLMMDYILNFGFNRGCDMVTLEVRPSNAIAIEMYQKFGFRVTGRRKGYYTDSGEDALLMTLDLSGWAGNVQSV